MAASPVEVPPEAEARKREADALAANGDLKGAEALYRAVTKDTPGWFAPWANLGNLNVASGDYPEAMRSYREAIRLRPDIAELHDNLGNVLRLSGELRQALMAHDKALSLKPELASAYVNRGVVLHAMGELAPSRAALESALRLAPDLPAAHYNLGLTLQAMSEWEQARVHYEHALKLASSMEDAVFALAGLDILEGHGDAARERLEALRASFQDDLRWVLMSAGLPESSEQRPAMITALEMALANPANASAEARRRAHFTAARLLDQEHRYDEAFEHYRQGNANTRAVFDAGQQRTFVGQMIAAFDVAAVDAEGFGTAMESDTARNGEPQPVFIIGMPRSGTSLIEQILAMHPQVHACGERTALHDWVSKRGGYDDPGKLVAVDLRDDADALLREWAAGSQGCTHLTDKMPANFLFLGLIARLFPNARVIHCVRDPADTGLSCFFQDFAGGNAWADDLDDIADYYREYRRIMAFWKLRLPLAMIDVHYQTVVDDVEAQARRVLDFLGLPWEPACLDFHASKRRARTASTRQVDRPIYRDSLARWRHYEAYIQPLLALREQFADAQ